MCAFTINYQLTGNNIFLPLPHFIFNQSKNTKKYKQGDEVLLEEYHETQSTVKLANHTLILEIPMDNYVNVTLIEFTSSTVR